MAHSDDDILRVTMRFAQEGHPESCAKLLLRVGERLRTGKSIPPDVAVYLAEGLMRVAGDADAARAFLEPSSQRGRPAATVDHLEVYFRVEELRSKKRDLRLSGDSGKRSVFKTYGDSIFKSEGKVKDAYYLGKSFYEKVTAEISSQKRLKLHTPPTIENARSNK